MDVNDFVCFNIVLPEKQELAFHQMEQFWVSTRRFKHPVSFEIISNGDMGRVIFQFLCHPEKQEQIRHQLTSIFPNSFFGSEENNIDYLTVWEEAHPRLDYIFLVSWLGLEKYYAYPLPTLTKFDTKDPLIGILSTFAEIQKNEAAVFQALVQPVKQNWKKQLQGETFREVMPAAQEKGEHPLFAICLRLAILGDNEHSTESVLQTYVKNVRNDLSNYGDETANKIGIESRSIIEDTLGSIYEGISRKPFIRDTNEWKEWMRLLDAEGAKIKIAERGQRIMLSESIFIDILNPFENLDNKEIKRTNDTSVVAYLSFNNTSFLFTGDISKKIEAKLIEQGNLDSDVLKIAHHGSKTSSSQIFLESVSPEIAVIQVGENSYGHPYEEVLSRLEESDIDILRTDEKGDIKIVSDGNNYKVK